MSSIDEDMVTCDNCGHYWDGYAQCCCRGIKMDDSYFEGKREHTMTLRSHIVDKKADQKADKKAGPIEEQLVHPECWNEQTHYGQCGQSCPCCRADVGDILGACLVCEDQIISDKRK